MALAISKLKLKYMAWQNCKTDIINWNKITEKTASLMLDQSETALKETIETAKLISSRVDKLISIQLPIATALIVYLFNNRISTITNFLPLTALLSLIIILISLFFCHKAFRKYDIAIPGEYPENIARSEFIDNDFDDNEQYINIVLSVSNMIEGITILSFGGLGGALGGSLAGFGLSVESLLLGIENKFYACKRKNNY